jgi:hypothetical protein
MSHLSDDRDDMTPPSAADDLDERRVEALLRGTTLSDEPRLAELISMARSFGHGTAPQPSAALAALLSGGAAGGRPASTADLRWRRRFSTVALVSIGSSAALVGAAAANVLPPRAQQVVARVVNDVSPLRLPGAQPVRPVPPPLTPAASPSPGAVPTGPIEAVLPQPTVPATRPTPAPTRTPDPGSTSEPGPAHPPGQVRGPATAHPTQATGRAEHHGRPPHPPSPSSAHGQRKGTPPARPAVKGPRKPSSGRPTPKPSPTADAGKGSGDKGAGDKGGGGKGSGGKGGNGG